MYTNLPAETEKIPAERFRQGFVILVKLLFHSVNADLFAVAAQTLKLNAAIHQCKEGIVGTSAHVLARMNVCATLFDEDIARQHKLAVCALHTKTLGLRVTAVEPIPFLCANS